jgi:hypothetical protein
VENEHWDSFSTSSLWKMRRVQFRYFSILLNSNSSSIFPIPVSQSWFWIPVLNSSSAILKFAFACLNLHFWIWKMKPLPLHTVTWTDYHWIINTSSVTANNIENHESHSPFCLRKITNW